MTVVPYKEDDAAKKAQVARMFDSISWRYDLLNHLLSVGVDVYWRRRAMRELKALKPNLILDVATGTGDLAIQAIKSLDPEKVIGVDISAGMMDIGRKKIEEKGLSKRIELRRGDSENLPFEENKFDAVIVAFGVRNFENLEKGLAEMLRVASALGSDFPFVRVDLYEIDGAVYFGELSFCPEAGMARIEPEDVELEWGALWRAARQKGE